MKSVRLIVGDIRDFKTELEHWREHYLEQIAPRYREKYSTYKIEEERAQALLSGLMLKRFLNVTTDTQLTYNQWGKPELKEHQVYFNLSHCENKVILGIAEFPIGVDIERIRQYHLETGNIIFSEEERREMEKLSEKRKNIIFTKKWTELEARLKLKGTGFDGAWKIQMGANRDASLITFLYEDYSVSCAMDEKAGVMVENCKHF